MRPVDLPPDLAWHTPTWDRQARSLRVGGPFGLEVAYVNVRADGATWLSTVNRHRGPGLKRSAVAGTADQATRWAERWALVRLPALRVRAEERARPAGKWTAFSRPAQTAVDRPLRGL